MVDFKVAINTTLLVVDDNIAQLELRTLVLTMSGFNVLRASNPRDAISILAKLSPGTVDVAVLDYEMPEMNGCTLADYIKSRYPAMGVILHSGCPDIPEREMGNVDSCVPKGEGVGRLLEQISALARDHFVALSSAFGAETSAAASPAC